MIVLFFKSSAAVPGEEDPDALPEKMRLILISNLKEARTPEEKEDADRTLEEFSEK